MTPKQQHSWLVVALVAAACGLTPAIAAADDVPTPAPAPLAPPPTQRELTPVEAEAKVHFDQGTAFLNAKTYDRAIDEFEIAYRLAPLPTLVFNIAQAKRLKGDLDGAFAKYTEYLKLVPSGPIADEARAQAAHITAIRDDEAYLRHQRELADKAKRDAAEAAERARKTEEDARRAAARQREVEALLQKRRTSYFIGAAGIGALAIAGVFIKWSADHDDEIRGGHLATANDIASSATLGKVDNATAWVFGIGGAGLVAWAAFNLFIRYPSADMPAVPDIPIKLDITQSAVSAVFSRSF